MDAVIYAAGRALRLGARSAECPKILLRFGGQTLLERHVRLLADAGIQRVFVVTGHLRERIGNTLPNLARRAGIPVVEIYNPDFTEGSVLSVAVSIPVLRACREGVLVMDGDVLYDQRMLARLIQSTHRSNLLLDRGYSTADDDPVLVPVRKGKPFDFRKRWEGKADFVGESIGFFKLHPTDIARLIEEIRRRAEGDGRGDSYDDALRTLVQAGRLDLEDVTGIPWTEVDFETDIDYGRDTILPQLLPLPGAATTTTTTTTPAAARAHTSRRIQVSVPPAPASAPTAPPTRPKIAKRPSPRAR